jgi:predicted amidophosphoribosyltransferase
MPIELTCPSCKASLRVKDKYAGQSGLCPRCKSRISVPAAARISEDAIVSLLAATGAGHADPDLPVHQDPRHNRRSAGLNESPSPEGSSIVLQHTRICPRCQMEVSLSYQACPQCRTYFDGLSDLHSPTNAACPSCGSACLPGDMHCATCGIDLRR